MKKLLLIITITTLLSSCGVGTYSIASGEADEGAVCFVAKDRYSISVDIDGVKYETMTIKQKTYKNNRKIKRTAMDKIILNPGRHQILVTKDGIRIYNHEIFVSATETKIIEL